MRGSKSKGPGVARERIVMSLPCGELLRAEAMTEVQDEQKLTTGLSGFDRKHRFLSPMQMCHFMLKRPWPVPP